MGKKKIATIDDEVKEKEVPETIAETLPQNKLTKKRSSSGVLYVESTYNNTKLSLTDNKGNTLIWSSSGAIGFKGAKKGTPFAAAKVGEALAQKAQDLGVREVKVVVKGVGSGRESAIRGFISKGINLTIIQDKTPVPHNGPKPPKPRRT
jgi:small subunit ribosomal protein S11